MFKKITWLFPGLIYLYRSVFKYPRQIRDWQNAGKPLPPPHIIKQRIINHHQQLSGYNILVESGTYMGDMVEAQRRKFKEIYSVELSEKLYLDVKKRFSRYKNVTIIHGDSGIVLPGIIDKLNNPAIFWLDGHYSGGITGKGDKETPIKKELQAIAAANNHKHIVLIDDARCFTGERDYPALEEIKEFVITNMTRYSINVEDDVIHILPG